MVEHGGGPFKESGGQSLKRSENLRWVFIHRTLMNTLAAIKFMPVRTYTYNIRHDSTRSWLAGFDGEEFSWTTTKVTALRLSGQEAERLLRRVKHEYPNAFLEAASKRV